MTTRAVVPTPAASSRATILSDPMMQALANATPAQIDAYVAAHVTDLASAKIALAFLAKTLVYVWQHR